jgi:uncharacterized membrane protein
VEVSDLEELFITLKGLFSKEFAILVAAMLPVTELRGSIPLAISWGLSPGQAFLISIIGNAIPVIPLLFFLEPVTEYLRRIKLFDKFFTWLYARTRKKSDKVEKYGAIGLILFTAIPFPTTGAWTASIAAIIFKIRFRLAFPAILVGILIAGIVVTILSTGIITF